MMLLGNDFLPTSISFRLKEEGHRRLIQLVAEGRVASAGGRLWSPEAGLDANGWLAILRCLAAEEGPRFGRAILKKLQARGDDTNPEDEPLRTRADEIFMLNGGIAPNWRSIYNTIGFGSSASTKTTAARSYIQGMRWVVDYYTGKDISMEWVYMWHFAPLWSTIVAEFETSGWIAPPAPGQRLLTPVEQLGMVLPRASWDLLPTDAAIRRLPEVAPEWFPESFHVQSIGKRFAWECEPEIPIPTPAQVWNRLA
jgi:5'-3' exoribonuclease 2